MIELFKPFVAPEAAARVAETLASGYLGEGKRVQEFEDALVPWIGPNAVVNSGTSALWMAYDLARVQGYKVITTPITCLATNIPLHHLLCRVLWADCDPSTGLIDPDSVYKLIQQHKNVRAVVAVDYGGQPANIPVLRQLADQYGIALIQDCAHSLGSFKYVPIADACCYSFQAIKHLTTGDGGSIALRDPDMLKQAKLKRWFGLDRSKGGFRCEQVVERAGYKFHMNDISASIGLANIPYVNDNISAARRHTRAYNAAGLGDLTALGSCWLYTLTVSNRDEFIRRMAAKGVQCARVHSSNKVHPIFRAPEQHTPGADEFDAKQVSIPVGYWLSEEDVQTVIKAVQESL